MGNEDDRGGLFKYVLQYVSMHLPQAYVIENVAPLKEAAKFRSTYTWIMSRLTRIRGYTVRDQVINTMHHGIPQNRRRLYIVGIKGEVQFKFPRSVAPVELRNFFDCNSRQPSDSIPQTKTGARNLLQCFLDASENHGVNPLEKLIIIDLCRSPSRGIHWSSDNFPCITRERGGTRGFWLSTLRRQVTVEELLTLQGFSEVSRAGLSDRQLGQMVADFQCNVSRLPWDAP